MVDVSFKISSGLKNIIGKDLITDDFIAVFELVKNSFDANAHEVEITFQGLNTGNPSIIIKDTGDGMDENDIKNKWLFVAYSAKKTKQDYRNKIKPTRIYAGAKGIGRFSCDRLGAKLRLITRKKIGEHPYLIIDVDWSKFEVDSESEFHKIPARLTQDNTSPVPKFTSGTVLEISNLRNNDWNRKKILELRSSLERLINPYQENDADNFSIILKVPEEEAEDDFIKKTKPDEKWNIVNGPIKNFIFEVLELKTTQLELEVDEDGEFIFTRLIDRGTLIYELIEKNPYPDTLHNIRILLFYLNKASKTAFTRSMGLRIYDYGSIFLYKNGFRIHPFGNIGDDSFGIDYRKQQGFLRRLGQRDLSGRIEINGSNPEFRETSSRDGGLIETEAFSNLKKLFTDYVLKRLENYTIELAKFGKGLEEIPEIHTPDSQRLREIAFKIITKLTQSSDVIDIDYDPNILNILENKSSKSVKGLLSNLKRISVEQNNTKLHKEISRAEKQVSLLEKAKEEAESEAKSERKKATQAEAEKEEAEERAEKAEDATKKAQERIKDVDSQNLFLKSVLSEDLEHVIELHHSIGQHARTIDRFSRNLLSITNATDKPIKRDVLQDILEKINYVSQQILTISRFATRANFRGDAEKITTDLSMYIREYLANIYGGVEEDPNRQKIKISFSAPENTVFETQFAPIKVSIVLDNLISNSRKHGTKHISVSVIDITNEELRVSFKDDGRGIAPEKISSLFQLGVTTTKGSGLGLYHSRNTMTEMNGNIDFNEKLRKGAEFFLTFRKQ